jgi:hypothetical protein
VQLRGLGSEVLSSPRTLHPGFPIAGMGLGFWRVPLLLKFIKFTLNSAVGQSLGGEIEAVNF